MLSIWHKILLLIYILLSFLVDGGRLHKFTYNRNSLLIFRNQGNLFIQNVVIKSRNHNKVYSGEASIESDSNFRKVSKELPQVSESLKSSNIISAAALIAGTTIGGGFLALPYTTVPMGAGPATVGLLLSWIFLLFCSFELASTTFKASKEISLQMGEDFDHRRPISIFTIAKVSLGNGAAACSSLFFLILMLATLIAQLSKAGTILGRLPFLKILSPDLKWEPIVTILTTILMSIITFSFGPSLAERLNSALTAIMLFAFSIILFAAKGAGWSASRLSYANFSILIPRRSHIWAIPVFMQLLVYAETIPTICARLQDERKVKQSIVLGSAVPLIMCILWTLTAIGLTSRSGSSFHSFGIDPVDLILQQSSGLLSNSVLALSLTAISTTIIGSLLALSQFFEDIVYSLKSQVPMKSQRFASRLLASIPATIVAACGSPSLYFACTSFAGAFPVTILWGLFPSLALLALDKRQDNEDHSPNSRKLKKLRSWALVAISSFMLLANVVL